MNSIVSGVMAASGKSDLSCLLGISVASVDGEAIVKGLASLIEQALGVSADQIQNGFGVIRALQLSECPHKVDHSDLKDINDASLLPAIRWLRHRADRKRELGERKASLVARVNEMQREKDILEEELESVKAAIETQVDRSRELDEDMKAVMETTRSHESTLKTLDQLIADYEKMRTLDKQFKREASQMLEEMRLRNEELARGREDEDKKTRVEDDDKSRHLEALQGELEQKASLARSLNQEVQTLPDPDVLQQCRAQIVELEEEIADEFLATQQLYIMFNSLEQQKAYLSEEVVMLTSIGESLESLEALSVRERRPFLDQMRQMLLDVERTEIKAQMVLNAEMLKVEAAEKALQRLQAQMK